MKKIYLTLIGLLSLVALTWVIQLSLQGKPVTKIKLSEFQSPLDLSTSIILRLRQELKDHPIVFLGVDPEEASHIEVWNALIKNLQEPGWKFDEIIMEKGLPFLKPLNMGEKILDIKENESSLKALWEQENFNNKRIVIIGPSIYSSQLVKDNPAQRLKTNPNDSRILSLTIVPLSDSTDAIEVNRIPCAASGADVTGESPLGCMIKKKAMFWNKKFKYGKNKSTLGIVEQVGLHDYLVYMKMKK